MKVRSSSSEAGLREGEKVEGEPGVRGRVRREGERKRTRSGSQSPSATPNNFSLAVPATQKSLGVVMQPILLTPTHESEGRERQVRRARNGCSREAEGEGWVGMAGELRTYKSVQAMKGLGLGLSSVTGGRPAMTGSMK